MASSHRQPSNARIEDADGVETVSRRHADHDTQTWAGELRPHARTREASVQVAHRDGSAVPALVACGQRVHQPFAVEVVAPRAAAADLHRSTEELDTGVERRRARLGSGGVPQQRPRPRLAASRVSSSDQRRDARRRAVRPSTSRSARRSSCRWCPGRAARARPRRRGRWRWRSTSTAPVPGWDRTSGSGTGSRPGR